MCGCQRYTCSFTSGPCAGPLGCNAKAERRGVVIKLSQEGVSFGDWSQIQFAKALNRLLGEIKSAKVLPKGWLLVLCRDSAQQGKAIRLNKEDGKKYNAQ